MARANAAWFGVVMPDQVDQYLGFHKPENQKISGDSWSDGRYRRCMDTLGSRLQFAREAAGLTQGELAERVSMAGQSSIQAIEAGNSKKPTKIYEIAKVCGVTVEWLKGETPEGGPKKFHQRPDAHKERVSKTQREQSSTRHIDPTLYDWPSIPELDLRAGASYGGGRSDEEWNHEGIPSDKQKEQWRLPAAYVERELGLSFEASEILQVRGDSMDDGTAKGLSSGDRVIIDRRDTDPRQGGIFAVNDGDGVIIKQVELLRGHEPPRIVCSSRNTSYRPIELILDGSVRIIGRVAGVISRR